ncbi:hypothetical protein [Hoeflea poritis]|uniref:LytR/CpsA/Psr regulator C-terminal domain-containing protein n=1 Tax=Hoeflea poritis TaxID=2993659 RepID=A0ABT4VU51_9HYPH|nr:hypothetical protein [Hoeflea poritis]MDA4848241.1 hypothetical protein [Hoeflea poritis]
MAENSPNDAIKNLNEWIEVFGGINPYLVLAIVGLAILAYGWYPRIKSRYFASESRKVRLMPEERRGQIINQNVTSHHQSGGITAHTVNINEKRQRVMPQAMKDGLLRELPKDRPIRVLGMNGDTESNNFAREIHDFLAGNGYEMDPSSPTWHSFFNPPTNDIRISEFKQGDKSLWHIVVGPAN